MTIEFIGSFIVFAFASLFGSLRNRWVFYLVAGLIFFGTYFLAFILGMALADLFSGRSQEKIAFLKKPAAALTLLVTGLIMASYPVIPWLDPVYAALCQGGIALESLLAFTRPPVFLNGGADLTALVYIFGAFLILLSLLCSRHLQAILSTRVPVFLGKISFSLYLIHMLVINTFSYFLLGTIFGYTRDLTTSLSIFLMTTLVLLGCSYLMYLGIDRQGVLLSKRIYERYFRPPGQDPSRP